MPKKTKTLTITPAKKSKYEEKKLSSGIDGLGLDEGRQCLTLSIYNGGNAWLCQFTTVE